MDINITQIQPYTNDELWSPEKFSMPKRSRLHHLEPIGMGTAMVESLTSYVTRLAHSHGVHLGTLIYREVVPHIPKTYKTTNLLGLRDKTGAINGCGILAQDLVQALLELTLCKNLFYLTMLNWRNIFPDRKLMREHKAWCPLCYQGWQANKQIIFEPLIWQIEAIQFCAVHQCPLQTLCPYCQQYIPVLSPKNNIGHCSNCFHWLGKIENYSNSTLLINYQLNEKKYFLWIAHCLGKLLSSATIIDSPPRNRISQIIQVMIQKSFNGNIAEFARFLDIPKNTLWMWFKGKSLPQLRFLLKICCCCRVDLTDLVANEENIKNLNILSIEPSIFPVLDKNQKVPQKALNHQQIYDFLRETLEEIPAPPMTQVAARLGIHNKVLRRRFPQLCKEISQRYLIYKKQSRLERIQKTCEEVKQAVEQLHRQGIYPSEQQVAQLISQPGSFRDKEVRDALHQMRCEMRL